jgi:hypothetical protein
VENVPEKPSGSYREGDRSDDDLKVPERFRNLPDIDTTYAAPVPASGIGEVEHRTAANVGMVSGGSQGLSLQRLHSASRASITNARRMSRPRHL